MKDDGSVIYVEDRGGFHREDTADDYGRSMKRTQSEEEEENLDSY